MAKKRISSVIVLLLLALSPGMAESSTNATVRLTVRVVSFYGIVVELYDESGRLIDSTDPAMPPLDVVMTTPDDLEVGLYIPETTLTGPTTIGIHLGGTTIGRGVIDRADDEGRQRGISQIPGLGPIEFTTDRDVGTSITIFLPYTPSLERGLVNNLAIFRLDEEDTRWIRLSNSQVDPSANSVWAVVDGFAIYRVMAQAASDLRNVVVYPNPFIPSEAYQGCLKFINLTPEATIRIYSIAGDLVWTEEIHDGGAATWCGTNDGMEPVASGVYIYVVTNRNGEEATGRISLIK